MQQPPNWQQPNTYYPPQQPPFQPGTLPPPPPQPVQSPPPRRKRNPWLIIGIIIGALILCGAIGNAITKSSPSAQATPTIAVQATSTEAPTDTPAPTPTPTQPPKWTTVQNFSGNGNKKTAVFSVPDDWKIVWSCYGFNDGSGIDGVLTVSVYNSDGTPADPGAVNATCKAGSKPTSDNTEEHQSGDVYLDVGATGSWTIQVQALK